ncbi:MAG: hypothetical protein RMY64_34960 [Nostoc sp. DedQUE08]|nr:hypothetical protein [Nostoc sp. DedQUE08]MDZ8070756.1 hypothetical protein [Nostoc sp. DedQUE08]
MYVYLHQAEKKLMRWLLHRRQVSVEQPTMNHISPMDSGEAAQSSNRDV